MEVRGRGRQAGAGRREEGETVSEHLTTDQLEGYRRRALAAAELLAVDDHLAACEECRRRLGGPAEVTAFHSLRTAFESAESEAPHPDFEQLTACLDGTADEAGRAAVSDHLQGCQPCAERFEGLREFKASLGAFADREFAPAEPESRRRQAPVFWRRPALRWPLFAGGAIAAALLVWAAASLLRPPAKSADAPPQIAHASPQPATPGPALTPAPATPAPTASPTLSPAAAVALNDNGHLITLDAGGNLSAPTSLTPAEEQLIKSALTTGRVETPPDLPALAGQTGALMGASSEGVPFPLVAPLGVVVESDRPTLRWQPLAGATGYAVTVYDSDFNKVAASPVVTATSWTVPQPLARGRVYTWQVKAAKDGQEIASPAPPAPEAKFKVLDRAQTDEIRRARAARPPSRMLLGLLYARAGLLSEAEQELQALLAASPDSTAVRSLLQSVRSARRAKSVG
jgi:predicted anti-sigma-YlaC factor YlaD